MKGHVAALFGTSMGVGEGKFTPAMEHFIEVYGNLVPSKKAEMNDLTRSLTKAVLTNPKWQTMYELLDQLPKGWTYKVDDYSVSLIHPRWIPIPEDLLKLGVNENLSNLCSHSDEDFLEERPLSHLQGGEE